ncbi:DNA polymerase III subunit delta [bacterium]|nr:DNA polymerase III subunit delta [bacterium]
MKEIKAGKLSNRYYVSGDSQYMKDMVKSEIKQRLDLGFEDFNLDEFWAMQVDDPRRIFDAILSIPVMSDRRMIIINDVHKLPAKFKKELVGFKIPDTSFLVLISPAPTRGQMDYHGKFKKAFKSYELQPPYDNELGTWIMEFVKEESKKMGGAAIGLFTSKVSLSLLAVRSELEKIYSYVGSRAEITRDDVLKVVSKSRTATIFQFVDAFGSRNIKECFNYSSELFDFGESATMMIFWLSKRSLEILQIISMLEKGASTRALASKLRVSEYWIKKYVSQARNYTSREIIEFISVLREGDKLIKSGKMGQKETISYIFGKLATIA